MKKAIIATFVFLAMQVIVPAIGTFIISVYNDGGRDVSDVSSAVLAPTVIGIELLFSYLLTIGALYAWRMLSPEAGLVARQKVVPLAMCIMLLLIVVTNLANEFLGLPDMNAEQMPALMNNPLCVFCIALCGPMLEETVFRRVIAGSLLEGGYRPATAITVSALLFAVVHVNPAQMPVAFVMGLFLGWLYVRTGSLVVPAACHVLNNVLGVVLYHAMPDAGLLQTFGGVGNAFFVAAACIVVGFVLLRIYVRLTSEKYETVAKT